MVSAAPAPVKPAAMRARIGELRQRVDELAGAVDAKGKGERLESIAAELQSCWSDRERSTELMREQARLKTAVEPISKLAGEARELAELAELAAEEGEDSMLADLAASADRLDAQLEEESLKALLSGPHAEADCFLDIQFGSGGYESQDWAAMLCRMYAGYADQRHWKTTIIDGSKGEHGVKSRTYLFEGLHAYGHLRTESGVHRLVRPSPFDANHRRHTTFASVFAYPVFEKKETEAVNPSDLRIDTFRASGAGGQHVNTTDSAVRITHVPTGMVVQCQNDRSQHKNRATAMSMLQSRLEMQAEQEQEEHKRALDAGKDEISWGSQIRSYVLDQSRVKDLRTGVESGNPDAVLDGSALHKFIEASLRAGV